MNNFFNKLKKTLFLAHFGSIFPIFGANKIFLENPALSRTTSYGFLATCQNLEKVNDTIQRKCPDRRKDGRTDLFYRTPTATARGSKMHYIYDNNTLYHLNQTNKKKIFAFTSCFLSLEEFFSFFFCFVSFSFWTSLHGGGAGVAMPRVGYGVCILLDEFGNVQLRGKFWQCSF